MSLGTYYVSGSGSDWSEPMPIDVLADRGNAGLSGTSTAYDTGYYGCQMKADSDSGIHMVFSNSQGVFYKRFIPPAHVTKRYFAGGQQVATRVDSELFYHLNDPSGTSLVLVDETGTQHWQVVYDGYGAVLTGTIPVTLTQTLLDMPDGTTGLVHLANGRYYDPTLGRPLQPNPSGMSPSVPQSLNRFAFTPVGQPGVIQRAQSAPLLEWASQQAVKVPTGMIIGNVLEGLLDLGEAFDLATVVRKTGMTQFSIVGTRSTIQAWTGQVFDKLEAGVIGDWAVGDANRIRHVNGLRGTWDDIVYLTGKVPGEEIERLHLFPNNRYSSYVWRTVDETVDVSVYAGGKALLADLSIGIALDVGFQLALDWGNPYLSPRQKLTRIGVATLNASTSTTAGLITGYLVGLAGPPGWVTGGAALVIGLAVDYWFGQSITPVLYEYFGANPHRTLLPLQGD